MSNPHFLKVDTNKWVNAGGGNITEIHDHPDGSPYYGEKATLEITYNFWDHGNSLQAATILEHEPRTRFLNWLTANSVDLLASEPETSEPEFKFNGKRVRMVKVDPRGSSFERTFLGMVGTADEGREPTECPGDGLYIVTFDDHKWVSLFGWQLELAEDEEGAE